MIQPRTIVEHKGIKGVVVSDQFGCCTSDETMVVFEGTTHGQGTLTTELKILGKENAIAKPDLCGAGKGDDCCIFLTCGANGFECERFGSLRISLIMKNMVAKRNPSEMFPACQAPLTPIATETI